MPTAVRRCLPVLLLGLSLLAPPSARADDPITSPMYRDPELPTAKMVPTFPAGLTELWLEALARPEADLKVRAARAIVLARRRGMPGLEAAVGPLVRELEKPDLHPTARLEVAHALIALDARDAAAALWRQAQAGDADLRELVEPAAARWDHTPARTVWLERLARRPARGRDLALAVRGLAAVRDEKAIPGLLALASSEAADPPLRLDAARALAVIRPSGFETDAGRLGADGSPRGLTGRLVAVALLRHHDGAEAVRLLTALARDPEPAVADVALTRLVEIDPGLVVPLIDPVLASPDANVRRIGVAVLRERPSDDHARRLGDRLIDPHPDVRAAARRALRELADRPDLRAAVIREGTRALAAADWRGQEQAAVLLGQLDHEPAAPRLVELLTAERPEAFVAAAWGLRELAVPDTLPAVLAHVQERHQWLLAAFKEGRLIISAAPLDRQMSQLAQLLGQTKYRPADAALRALVTRFLPGAKGGPPFTPVGPEGRAAAIWALGRLHEGKADAKLAQALVERLTGDPGMGPDDERVRRMSAVTLGRMQARDTLRTVQYMAGDGKPTADVVAVACRWAAARITDKPVPPPGQIEVPQRDWFLKPIK